MNNHLILVSRERIIGAEINETSNLVYTEIKIRTEKYECNYRRNDEYKKLIERELTSTGIEKFKANKHLYTKVHSNEYGTIYQYGKDFKKMYWDLFPKEGKIVKPKKELTHKVCSLCKKELPVKDFYVRQNKQLFSRCKKCTTAR